MTNVGVQTNIGRAREALRELLETHHAVVWPEAEARLSERPWRDIRRGINPHLLLRARSLLLEEGVVETVSEGTRGGRIIEVHALADRRRKQRPFEVAARRRRLLYARYLGWAAATTSRPSLIGAAGERVTHASLMASMQHGFVPVQPQGGEINQLFGEDVPGGPLDNAAHLVALDRDGRPLGTVTLLIEVKNIRRWIYPWSHELYELLDKATRLQERHPGIAILPMLVCRRAHFITFKMAKSLGFYVVQTLDQYILPLAEATLEAVSEVNHELGFNDLTRTEDAVSVLTDRFSNDLKKSAWDRAQQFGHGGPKLRDYASILRGSNVDSTTNHSVMHALRSDARQIPNNEGGW